MAHMSRLRSELLSRRELTQLAEMQLAKDESTRFKGWPMCGTCLRPVRAYGIENETPSHKKFWARCRHDGHDVWENAYIKKPHGPNAVAMLVFFCR